MGGFSPNDERPNKNTGSDAERRVLYAEKDFLHYFERATKYYGFFGLLIPFLLFVLDTILCGSIPDILPAIIMELVGAWVLTRAVLIGSSQMRNVSTSGFGGPSPSFRKALAPDVADGIWGVSLLVTGIILQSIISAGITLPAVVFC